MTEPRQDSQERIIEAPQTQNVLEKKFARDSKGDTTPSVLNVEKIVFKNVAPLTVTKFDDVQPNQEITMLGDGFTTIQNNAKIETASGADTLLAAGKVYRYTHLAGKLHEDAGSAGGGGVGPPGADGATGMQGVPGGGIVTAEAPREPMMIPGVRGAKGDTGAAGRAGLTILPDSPLPPIEPLIVQGPRGKDGAAGNAVAAGGHEGVLSFGQPLPSEPPFIPMVGRPLPAASQQGELLVGRPDGSWQRLAPGPQSAVLTVGGSGGFLDWEFPFSIIFLGAWLPGGYFFSDAVRYKDGLWSKTNNNTFPDTTPPDEAGSDWILLVQGVHQHEDRIGWPRFAESLPPIEPMIIPGPKGKDGAAGVAGVNGKTVIIPGLDGRDGQEPMMIPGKAGAAGAPGAGGTDPFVGSQAPGSFAVATGKYAVIARRLILTGVQRVTLQGTGVLRLI